MSGVLWYPSISLSEGSLRTWAIQRREDIFRREHQHSLNVGLNKPLGGQGFQASFAGLWSMWKICRAAKKQNASGSTRFISGGAVGGTLWMYAYDRLVLEDILLDHSELLSAEGWPCADADAFIQKSRDVGRAVYADVRSDRELVRRQAQSGSDQGATRCGQVGAA